jgi:chromosome partitioning protein
MAISCTFLNLKPGTTKTTSAVYTAAALARRDLVTMLVDADPAGSAQRWADLADRGGDPFPFHIVGMSRKSIARELPALAARMRVDAVVVDTPQMEDHADIARGAMAVTQTWIVPVAPAGIEIDRTMHVYRHMDQVEATLQHSPERLALLTRTNRRKPSKTATAPDAVARAGLTRIGLTVFADQVPINDDLYRQTYSVTPDPTGTPYERLAEYLAVGAGSIRALRAVQ